MPDNNQTAKPKKILCIEDEFFISELYERALKKSGHKVTTALNGTDGLQIAQTNNYDVVLLDLMVPGTTGMEILRILRDPIKSPNFRSKIIITTNLDQNDATRAEVEEQADGYLVKAAITPRELAAFVDKLDI